MFHPPEESAPVQGLIAQPGHDAVISIVGREVMLRMWHPTNADPRVLERIDPTRYVVPRHVRPFVKFLRCDFDGTKDREEKGYCEDMRRRGDAISLRHGI